MSPLLMCKLLMNFEDYTSSQTRNVINKSRQPRVSLYYHTVTVSMSTSNSFVDTFCLEKLVDLQLPKVLCNQASGNIWKRLLYNLHIN
ncbi:hypothetical protein GDO78_009806 [Eleutherodactylus coqui]|uniref:Uncharacterized protein n=1 Tax=Eleutherodactylus coqui TaxID=57060 RepID=A0A8J6F9K9_ELECQ|nr:hypothetical protein GDO78_009806 [Eleutherodactylus coqui]